MAKSLSRRLEKLEQAAMTDVLPNPPVSPANGGPGVEATTKELPNTIASDARPDPKPRKHPALWQSYLWWYELMEMRKRHTLRISSIEKGKSNLDAQIERDMLEAAHLDELIKGSKKMMKNYGSITPIWKWVTSIKGLGGECGLAAQLVAQIDDIEKFDTVASLWRFAGFAVMEGKAEKNQKGEKSHFNRRLKGVCFNIADQFIKQQTPGYVEIYYAEKEKQRALYPEPVSNGNGKKIYTDAHIHNRAWRKMVKAFLMDLWIEWKQARRP
jgi:hypothetical protein